MDDDHEAEEAQVSDQQLRRELGDPRKAESDWLERARGAGADALREDIDEDLDDDEAADATAQEEVHRLRRFGMKTEAVVACTLRLRDIDDSDLSLQFRFSSKSKELKESLDKERLFTPISVGVSPNENGYRIIDGFCRVAAAKDLGWTEIRANVYSAADEDDLRKMAFVVNVTRRNLSPAERANAMQVARREGYDKSDIAALFSVTERTVQRALAVSEHILRVVDGRVLTMAHAKVLQDAHDSAAGGLSPEAVEELAEEVRERSLTAKQLTAQVEKPPSVAPVERATEWRTWLRTASFCDGST